MLILNSFKSMIVLRKTIWLDGGIKKKEKITAIILERKDWSIQKKSG